MRTPTSIAICILLAAAAVVGCSDSDSDGPEPSTLQTANVKHGTGDASFAMSVGQAASGGRRDVRLEVSTGCDEDNPGTLDVRVEGGISLKDYTCGDVQRNSAALAERSGTLDVTVKASRDDLK